MAVDKGGLRYPIEVIDLFTKDFERFRRQVREARRTMGAFRAEAAAFSSESQSISKASREIGRSSKQIAAGQRSLEKSAQTSKKVAQDTAAATEKQISASKKASAATKSVADEEKAQLKRLRDQEIVQRARLKQKKDLAKAEREFRTELKKTRTLQQQAASADPAASQISQADLRRQLGELNQKANELDKLDRAVNGRTQERRSRRIIGRYDQELKDAQTLKEVQALNQRRTQEYDQRRLRDARDFSEKLKQQMEQRYATEDRARKQNEKSAKKSLDRQQRDVTKAQAQFDRLSEKAARGQRLTNKEFFDRLRAQQVVRTGQPLTQDDSRRINAAERRSATIEAAKNAKAEKTVTQQVGKTTVAAKGLKQQLQSMGGLWKTIGDRMRDTESSANRLSFTFRRLFGILAAFAVARAALQGFRALIRGAVEFNSKLEQSRLGIASLITAVGDVADITGRSADAATQLELAQKEARRQTELLRKEAIQTAATFDQLVETFQVGLAPGLTAGLDIDQIRKLTVQISQAATAIGLPQNQLAEEIRSLLSGTIQARTTRIATSLGITNEDIRKMKEAGTLAEFLQARFAAFEKAGKKASQTFAALFTNTKAAFQQVIDTGFVDFFKELRGVLNDVQSGLADLSGTEIQVNPKAVQAARALGDGLARAVAQARLFVQNLSGGDVAAFASSVGSTVALLATGARAVIEGVIGAVGGLSRIFAAFLAEVRTVVNGIADSMNLEFQVDSLSEMLRILVKVSVVLTGIAAVFGAVSAVSKTLIAPMLGLFAAVTKVYGGLALVVKTFWVAVKAALALDLAALPLTVKFLAIVAIVGLIYEGLRLALSYLTGTNLKAETLFKIISNKVVKAVKAIYYWFKAVGLGVAALGRDVLRYVLWPVQKALEGLNVITFGIVGGDMAKSLEKFRSELEKTSNANVAAGRAAFAESQRLTRELFSLKDDDTQKFLADNEKARGLMELLGDSIKGVGQALASSLDGVFGAAQGASNEIVSPLAESRAKTLEEVFQNFPGYISTAAAGMKEVEEKSRKVKDLLRDAQTELAISRQVGFRSDADQAVIQSLKLRKQLQEDIKALEKQSEGLTKRREALLVNVNRLLGKTEQLSDSDRENLYKAYEALRERLVLQGQIRQQEAALDRVQVSAGKAVADGDVERVAALKNELLGLRSSIEGLKTADQNYGTFLRGIQDLFPEQIRTDMVRLIDDLLKNEMALNGVSADRLRLLQAIQEQVRQTADLDATRRLTAAKLRNVELADENKIFAVRAQNARRLSSALQTRNVADDRAAELKNALEIARIEAQIEQEKLAGKRQQLSLDILSGKYKGEALQALEDQLLLTDEQLALLKSISAVEQERQNKALAAAEREAALRNEGGFFAGAEFGLGNFADQFRSLFDAFANIAEQSMSLISSTISDSLLDAFDPTDNAKTIQERFRDLMRGIIKIILDELIRSAIANIILGALGGASGSAGSATGGGFFNTGAFGLPAGAKGGEIRGYASGGPIRGRTRPSVPRPRGLDPRDKVPIFAQEGEWMMRLSAVKRYGLQAMHAINEGLVDPSALQALAGSFSTRRTTRVAKKVGYAEGGMVATPRPATGASSAPATAQEGSGPQQAIVLFGPEEFERMLAANKSGMIRFMRENKRAAGIQR